MGNFIYLKKKKQNQTIPRAMTGMNNSFAYGKPWLFLSPSPTTLLFPPLWSRHIHCISFFFTFLSRRYVNNRFFYHTQTQKKILSSDGPKEFSRSSHSVLYGYTANPAQWRDIPKKEIIAVSSDVGFPPPSHNNNKSTAKNINRKLRAYNGPPSSSNNRTHGPPHLQPENLWANEIQPSTQPPKNMHSLLWPFPKEESTYM